jgi:pimeloyl-ACP methyl ester carboxylesterase
LTTDVRQSERLDPDVTTTHDSCRRHTALPVDASGGTPALLFLSVGFGTVQNWSRVIRRLDGKYRTVRFDARARGKSGRSAEAPDTVVAAIEYVIHESS